MTFRVGDQVRARGHEWLVRRIVLTQPDDPRLLVKRPDWRYTEVLHPHREKVTRV